VLAFPAMAFAANTEEEVFGLTNGSLTLIGWIAVGAIAGAVLARVWVGIFNHLLLEHETIASVEKRSPYFPKAAVAIITILSTGVLFLLSLKVLEDVAPFSALTSAQLLLGFGVVGVAAVVAQLKYRSARDYVFAFLVGSFIVIGLLGWSSVMLQQGARQDPFITSLGIICMIVLWRFLFGPWKPRIKAMVLGTFLLWIAIHVLFKEAPEERFAHVIAAAIALVPALVWCWFFLEYHKQRKSLVLLMFFAGMLSTAPILFYDALVRRGVEFQFFLFRVVPENFNRVSSAFVSGTITDTSSINSTILTMLISFLIVGLIEEISKLWVLKESGKQFFTSIDDVIQLAVIVAIGFAFAENVLNPSYFLSFVREYLIDADTPQWWAFLGNVSGRAILTTMVHIVSSGVMGYFLGLTIFAKSYLADERRKGHVAIVASMFHWFLRLPEKKVFRVQMIVIGLMCATVLHGLFNFMVTLPDLLPGRPETFGELMGLSAGSILHNIPILLLPSFLYIVGGFWVFTALFYRQENMKERGRLVETDTFVRGKLVGA